MTDAKHVLFLGATGYVGAAVLSKLIALPNNFTYTCMTRSEDKAKKLESLRDGRIKGVVGTFEDAELIEKLASEADITFNCADSDDVGLNKAVLAGARKRKAATGHRPILIHTSGTGTLIDDAKGQYPTEVVYSDLRENPTATPPLRFIASLPDTAFHRKIDLMIVAADQKAEIRSWINLPGTIYGIAKNEVVDAGVGNPRSRQIPDLVNASIKRKRAGMIGGGQNIWPNVHIDDVADLQIKLLEYALSGKKGKHGGAGYYFAESGEHTLFAVGQTIGRALVDNKITEESEPTTFTEEELKEFFAGSAYLGSNSRCRADNSRQIGWRPKHGVRDFFVSIGDEVKASLKEQK